jgi:hypothetical protein
MGGFFVIFIYYETNHYRIPIKKVNERERRGPVRYEYLQ